MIKNVKYLKNNLIIFTYDYVFIILIFASVGKHEAIYIADLLILLGMDITYRKSSQ